MKTVKWWVFPLVALVLIFGTVEVAKATGFWVSNGRQTVQPGQAMKPTDLKGWMTIQQAADGLGMPADELIAIMAPPAGVHLTPTMAFKDVEAVWPDFELSALRTKLQAGTTTGPVTAPVPSQAPTTGQPVHTPPSGAGTPRSGNGNPGGNGTPGSGNGTPKASKSPGTITGQMTLQQVADQAGVDVKALIKESGLPEGTRPTSSLKDLRSEVPGFEIQQVRDAVARLTAG